MRSAKTLILFALIFVFAVASANADTIRLKNGTVVKGKVINFANGSFTVALDLGSSSQSRVILDNRDIESIEFDNRSGGDSNSNVSSAAPRENPVPRPSSPDDDSGHRPTPITRPTPVNSTPVNPPPRTTSNPPINTNPSSIPAPTSGSTKEVVALIPAKDDWTYTNVSVHRGDRIKLSATGRVKISASKETGPEGVEQEDRNKLLLEQPTGALIAVIGDDNDEFLFVGRESEIVAKRDGKLFLSVNEGDLTDNNGSFNVRIRVEPNK